MASQGMYDITPRSASRPDEIAPIHPQNKGDESHFNTIKGSFITTNKSTWMYEDKNGYHKTLF